MLVGCVALLSTAPEAGAIGTGTISGTVTHEGSPVTGVRVEVFSESHAFVNSAFTASEGKYALEGLSPGSYYVLFRPFSEPKLVPQYYKEKTSFSTAELLPVEEGKTKEANAELHEGGKIAGMVTDAGLTPLAGVEVFAIPVDGNEFAFGVEPVKTEPSGKYELKGLPKGKYKVGFFPEEGVNLVAQYYNERLSFALATEVEVKEQKTTPEINAKLSVGGKITGTVTDAVSHKPLAHVAISAVNPATESFGFGFTNASGEYTIVGLSTGSYIVEFEQFTETEAPSEYINQTRSGIEVVQGSTTSGINAALVPTRPNNTGAPVASGTPSVGQTLSCSRGTWTGVRPLGYSYRWLRDGAAFGASGNTYVVQAADQGHGLACEVTASNRAGHGSATSNTLAVPAPPPPPPPPNSEFTSIGGAHLNEKNGQISIVANFPTTGSATVNGIVQHGATLARVDPATLASYEAKVNKCKRRSVRKHGKCVSDAPVLYGVTVLQVKVAATYTIIIKPTARVLKALKAGKRLSVTVSTTFQNAKGGAPVTHVQIVTAKIKKPRHHH